MAHNLIIGRGGGILVFLVSPIIFFLFPSNLGTIPCST